MGGHAFKGYTCKRIADADFLQMFEKIKCKLQPIFPNSRIGYVGWMGKKESHGDMDILLEYNPEYFKEKHLNQIKDALGATDYVNGGNTKIFNVDGYEIDIIFVKHYEFAELFYRFGGFGDVAGSLLKIHNLKFQDDGISYILKLDGNHSTEIFITYSVNDFEAMLGIEQDTLMQIESFDELANILFDAPLLHGSKFVLPKKPKTIHLTIYEKFSNIGIYTSKEELALRGYTAAKSIKANLDEICEQHRQKHQAKMERAKMRKLHIASIVEKLQTLHPNLNTKSREFQALVQAELNDAIETDKKL